MRRACRISEGLAFETQAPLRPDIGEGSQPRGRKPRRTGHNLLLRLESRRQDVLCFLTDPEVPFTNNQAERDVRMMKVKQKVSGGFRSLDGAVDFALIRSSSTLTRMNPPPLNLVDPPGAQT